MSAIFFRSDTDKRPIIQDRPPRRQVEPKLTISKRITGDWHLEKKFDRYPKDFGTDTHNRS
jgi:hypothetical protein